MGIFSRFKKGVQSKANGAIDALSDPEKELELAIQELEEGQKKALQELVEYKKTVKLFDRDLEKAQKEQAEWEKRAMDAVRAGDDELAKKALTEKKRAETKSEQILKDKREAQTYAVQLNRSRKKFETKLRMLKLRKGTLSSQLRVAKGDNALELSPELAAQMERAEDEIAMEEAESEVGELLGETKGGEFESKVVTNAKAEEELLRLKQQLEEGQKSLESGDE